ncbi:MAG: beta-N-acetylhexosaminidase [Armatimonadetes bacterium]|nr:beta-N-acetylhexosaminidase [Armatimonadota bacterium]NIO57446.1 beta-N-acetylhexosaminidase [Candidatus Latescibacterota bacterium]NIM24877.1 beta-N-acetylhexosaminidase [Armatimonadota bacterium]NIM68767.1 beta-N-acetylhexosaminidase [Armatimonadota bacterium]NIM77028.1 beta-N-acetylhexosaminidase [Armatimonadota bacterium]
MSDSTALRQRLGQLLVVGFDGTEVNGNVRARLADIRPAGVILFARNLIEPQQVRRLTADLQAAAEELGIGPFVIGIDHEGGAIVRMGEPLTAFSGNLALGAAGSLDLAGRQAHAMAEELLALGFNWNFAPCVDVNSNPRNPVIGVRSFGDDPSRVAEFGGAMIGGFQSRGVIACAKHFPGHGDTEVDSHIGLPRVSRSIEELREVEWIPFQAAIAAEVASIMTAHVVFPALEAERPATVSRRIITGLLREEMDFDGVVVSDALEMAGLADSIGVAEGAVACINAGVDLALACNSVEVQDEALAALQQAFERGEIAPETVAEALKRVDEMKQRFLLQHPDVSLSRVGCKEHRELEKEIAAAGVTLLRDDEGLLPIGGSTISISSAGIDKWVLSPLKDVLSGKYELADASTAMGTNLLITCNLHRRKESIPGLRKMLGDCPRTILLAVGYPEDCRLLPEARTALATYGSRPASLKAAAAVLLGEAHARGKLPLKA